MPAKGLFAYSTHNPGLSFKTEDPELSQRLRLAFEVLEAVARDRALLAGLPAEDRARFIQAAGQVYCPNPAARRGLFKAVQRLHRARKVERDQAVLEKSGIRSLRKKPVFTTPNVTPPVQAELGEGENPGGSGQVDEPQNCYICKRDYSTIHHFYDQLCPPCAEVNFRKRTELADLSGRVALLTGGRVKIGYQAGIKLLRAGVHLIVTTRFPRDSAARST